MRAMRQKNQIELNLGTGARGEAPKAAAQNRRAAGLVPPIFKLNNPSERGSVARVTGGLPGPMGNGGVQAWWTM